jgi:hypothetical protein
MQPLIGSEIIEDFLKTIGFTHIGLYMQDYDGKIFDLREIS